MAKFCNTCGKYKHCSYRGIINPCDEWIPSSSFGRMRKKAKDLIGLPMSMKESQFVTSATTALSFTPKQETWLLSIYARKK